MSAAVRAYRYPVDQCDVLDKVALAGYRDKRLLWLSWLVDDEVHAISQQVLSAMWNDVSFRAIAQMAELHDNNPLYNSLIAEALIQGHFAVQTLIIRRLFDGRNDVISLRRLVRDLNDNQNLFTREFYVCHDGLPYDFEAVENAVMQERIQSGGGPFWGERQGPKAWAASQMRHKEFDRLSHIAPGNRDRNNGISPLIFDALTDELDNCAADDLIVWSHKMLAHAADSGSRSSVKIDQIGPDLAKLSKVHRAIVQVTEMVGGYLLGDAGLGMVVPIPQYNQFANLAGPIATKEDLPGLHNLWDSLAKERDGWVRDAHDIVAPGP
jgi:hypothetical protein